MGTAIRTVRRALGTPPGSRGWAKISPSTTKGAPAWSWDALSQPKTLNPVLSPQRQSPEPSAGQSEGDIRDPDSTSAAAESAAQGPRVRRGAAGLLSAERSASSSRPLSRRRLGKPPQTPPPCWAGISDSDSEATELAAGRPAALGGARRRRKAGGARAGGGRGASSGERAGGAQVAAAPAPPPRPPPPGSGGAEPGEGAGAARREVESEAEGWGSPGIPSSWSSEFGAGRAVVAAARRPGRGGGGGRGPAGLASARRPLPATPPRRRPRGSCERGWRAGKDPAGPRARTRPTPARAALGPGARPPSRARRRRHSRPRRLGVGKLGRNFSPRARLARRACLLPGATCSPPDSVSAPSSPARSRPGPT